MTPHEIDLRREYEHETGIEFITVTGANTKKYVRWLENRLLSSSHNSEYKSALKVYKEFDEYDTAGELVFSDWLHARLNQQS